jgi:Ca2+-binding RTX toxin-like protein
MSNNDALLVNVENVSLGNGASVSLVGQTEAAGFTITGGGGAETITGSNADDRINGGLGNDVMSGAAGADAIDGQAGFDTVSYSDVTTSTSHGQSNVVGMAVNLSANAVTDANIDLAFDFVAAGTYLTGNNGGTSLAAGTGEYLLDNTASAAAYSIDALTSVEGVVGSALNDYIVLGDTGMTVDGGAGTDVLISGGGTDTLLGGDGNDEFFILSDADHGAGEVITGGAGTDTLTFASTGATTLVLSSGVTGVENIEIEDLAAGAGASNESINASALTYGVVLRGNDGINTITGTAFADIIRAGAGNDTIVADDADTLVDGEAGTDDVMQLAANATFTASQLTNIENVTLADGVSLTVDYTDVVDGAIASQIDAVTGVTGGATETLIINGASTGAGVTMSYAAANLTLTSVTLDFRGGNDAETVTGTASADIISGGLGNDIITGGAGADNLTGGAGADQFNVAGASATVDTINDFTIGLVAAGGDAIDFTNAALVAAPVVQTDFAAQPVVRADGLTIESFAISATGVVTLYDERTGSGTTEVFAQTAADALAIATALAGQAAVVDTAQVFKIDADANGVAESSFVFSEAAANLEMVQLIGVSAVDLAANALGVAGDITII